MSCFFTFHFICVDLSACKAIFHVYRLLGVLILHLEMPTLFIQEDSLEERKAKKELQDLNLISVKNMS